MVVGLRRRTQIAAIAISIVASIASLVSNAPITSALLFVAAVYALWLLKRPVTEITDLSDWLIALEGKDPFDPDAKPNYIWCGFATTFVVSLRAKNHPTLTGKTLCLFRGEIDDDAWRTLVTRIRHGRHTHASPHEKSSRLRRLFE
jgi:hypothetical protein